MGCAAVEVGDGVAVDEAQRGLLAEELNHRWGGVQEGAGAGLVEALTEFVAQVVQGFVDGLDDASLDAERIARQPHPAARPGGGAAVLRVFLRDDDLQTQVRRRDGRSQSTGPGADHQQIALKRGGG